MSQNKLDGLLSDITMKDELKALLLDLVYPVNSIHISFDHINPAEKFGGVWERMSQTFLWGTDEGDIIGNQGGEMAHTLTINEMPGHSHTLLRQHWYASDIKYTTSETAIFSVNQTTSAKYIANGGGDITVTGGNREHNNMPPFTNVSIWRRTA